MKPSKKNNGGKAMTPKIKHFFENFWNADQFFPDDFFLQMRNRWLPAVNIKDNKGDFEIDVAAPGFNKKDFDIRVENGMIFISAKMKESKEEKETNYTRKEFSYSSFERSFTLPENIDEKSVSAKYSDGVLKLTLKKLKAKKPATQKVVVK